eukprot:PLAT8272.1.p1 GENE.PLAT8272.1~~PLAT8272.1.p1  ORF type:complete len:241 (+),score=71.98 PLAT8272.1:25-723(+)
MGAVASCASRLWGRPEPFTCMFIGLDGAGKTTLINHLLPPRATLVLPTAGVDLIDDARSPDGRLWRVWDLSGSGRNRALWEYYFGFVQAIVLVIDMSDTERLGVVREELRDVLEHPDVRGSSLPLLIFANKSGDEEEEEDEADRQRLAEEAGEGEDEDDEEDDEDDDWPRRLTLRQIERVLQLDSLKHPVKLLPSSGLTGAGIEQGFNWLGEACSNQARRKAAAAAAAAEED